MAWFNNNRVGELEKWRGEVTQWKSIVHADMKTLKSWRDEANDDLKNFKSWKENEIMPWKDKADAEFKTLRNRQKDIFKRQGEFDIWGKIVDKELGELDKNKLDISDYRKERDRRDEKFIKLEASLDEAMPKVAKGLSKIGDRVAKIEEKTSEIEEAVCRLKKEKKKPNPAKESGGSAIKTSQFPDGNIYVVQQQLLPVVPFGGFGYSSPSSARACGCHHTPCVHVGIRINTSPRKKWCRN